MKYILGLIIYFYCFTCFSQVRIDLVKSEKNNKDYIFKKPIDSIYLNVGHIEDMGAWYGYYFEFKKSIPDGKYEVYVNDRIKSTGLIKNSNKEGLWKEYSKEGNLVVIHKYKKGILNGKEIWKYKNKKTNRIVKYKNGKVVWYKNYNEDGKLVSKNISL